MSKTRTALRVLGRFLNEAVSLVVFCGLDIIDSVLCFLYKTADYLLEAEWKPCYCLSPKQPVPTTRGNIHLSHNHNNDRKSSDIPTLSLPQELSVRCKIQLEEISDTLYARDSVISELSKLSFSEMSKRMGKVRSECDDELHGHDKARKRGRGKNLTVNFTVVEMLQGKMKPRNLSPATRWSDCDCGYCACWASSSSRDQPLFVQTQFPKGNTAREDVLFIHGFISSSSFWTETVFPNLSDSAKSTYRLFAVDLLGFGKSPKPSESLYTLREHVEMIERWVLQRHNVKSFHVVAHSLGCVVALGLAVRHAGSVKSLTLLAPPYYPVPAGEAEPTQYVMRKVAPRRVWPPLAFGASMACWYEHISRTICLLICKNHRLWEFLARLITRNRIRTFLMEGFFCHTHNAAWHTLHNIICGTGSKLHTYLDIVRDKLTCDVTIFHGSDDELIPVDCSYNVQRRLPRARVKVVENKDHITIVVGRQRAFARELEEIWKTSS